MKDVYVIEPGLVSLTPPPFNLGKYDLERVYYMRYGKLPYDLTLEELKRIVNHLK